jgi:long-chain acyl-CoA synthetase
MRTSSEQAPDAVRSRAAAASVIISDDDLPLQRVYRWEREKASELFLTQPLGGRVWEWRWAEAMDEVRRMAAYLEAQQWPPGSRIVILSKNCAWWLMAELAVWMSGHVSVPIYASLSAQSVRALLEHCEPVCCFFGAVDDTKMGSEGIPPGVKRIHFPNAAERGSESWESIIAATAPETRSPVRGADELATIIYTSGTTGTPKGVMHRFRAFPYFVLAEMRTVPHQEGDRLFSYLPLAHIAERGLVEACAFSSGLHVFFVEKIETFLDDLKRARPTIFFSVPRLFIKFQQRVLAKVPQPRLDRLLRIPLVNRLVGRRILRELGFDSMRLASSGGAPLPVATLEWFRKLGLNLVEGYGMTETGISHTPPGGRCRPGYVGDGIPGVETRIAENGEVLIKSPMNMIGYYKDPEKTRQAFTEDGFFRTGDLGELDEEGWLKIVGRVKEQFKTSKGKYVSPARIEKLLGIHPDVEACCVMGSGMAGAFAIVLLPEAARRRFADAAAREEFERSLEALRRQVNAQLEAHERLEFLVVVDESWTIENGFLTPTMKLRRAILENHYADYFDSWIRQDRPIVWHRSSSSVGV